MGGTATSERASSLLEGLRTSLASDGYELRVEPAEAGIHVIVSADSDTCADCLVPEDVFRGILSTVLEKGGLVMARIDVTYPASGAH